MQVDKRSEATGTAALAQSSAGSVTATSLKSLNGPSRLATALFAEMKGFSVNAPEPERATVMMGMLVKFVEDHGEERVRRAIAKHGLASKFFPAPAEIAALLNAQRSPLAEYIETLDPNGTEAYELRGIMQKRASGQHLSKGESNAEAVALSIVSSRRGEYRDIFAELQAQAAAGEAERLAQWEAERPEREEREAREKAERDRAAAEAKAKFDREEAEFTANVAEHRRRKAAGEPYDEVLAAGGQHAYRLQKQQEDRDLIRAMNAPNIHVARERWARRQKAEAQRAAEIAAERKQLAAYAN